MADYPATSVPLFVDRNKPQERFTTWAQRNIERTEKRARLAQYQLEKKERERVATEAAAEEAKAEALKSLRYFRQDSDNSQDSTGEYDVGDMGSPSPAAKARRDKKAADYAVFDRLGITDDDFIGYNERRAKYAAEYEASKKNKPPVVEDPNAPWVIARKKQQASEALLKRLAASTTPLFIKPTTDIAFLQAAETARQSERKIKGLPEPSLTEAELDPTWGSKRRGHPEWVQRIIHPELFHEEHQPLTDSETFAKPIETLLPSVEVSAKPTTSSNSTSVPEQKMSPMYNSTSEHAGRSAYTNNVQAALSEFAAHAENNTYMKPTTRVKSPDNYIDSMWNGELEFTEDSIEVSMSPQLQIKRFDRMRNQDIENTSARGVAVTQLDRIRERNSEERSVLLDIPSRLATTVDSNAQGTDPKVERQSLDPSQKQSGTGVSQSGGEEPILEDRGIAIPDTPVTMFDARTYRGTNRQKSAEELQRMREDSFDALKQLSRSLSRSPPAQSNSGTSRAEKNAEISNRGEKEEREEENLESIPKIEFTNTLESKGRADLDSSKTSKDADTHSRPSSLTRSDIDPEERIAAEAKLFELQDNKSEKNSTRAPSPLPSDVDDDDDDVDESIVEETPKQKKQDPLSLPTPRVMGAFIETPAPTIRKPRSEDIYSSAGTADKTSQAVKQERPDTDQWGLSNIPAGRQVQPASSSRPRPPLINTAKKFSVADDIRRLKLEAGIDDSTDDFDTFTGTPVTKGSENDEEDVPASPVDELISAILRDRMSVDQEVQGRALSAKERDRRIQQSIVERMDKHLKKTTSSLRDTRHGIERIEKQVQTTIEKPMPYQAGTDFKPERAEVPIVYRKEEDAIYIKFPVPRLWKYDSMKGDQQKFVSRNWKFTWLGLILALFATWYVAETVTCDIYCHPQYASKNTWQPSDPFFPWAIPTKIDQWTGEYASAGFYRALDYVEEIGRGSKRTTFRQPRPTPTMGSDAWWVGREGPRGIIDVEATRTHSMFADEVVR